MADQDQGQGDPEHYPAEDLERLYLLGGINIAARVRGSQLNLILQTKRYAHNAWYLVTAKGVERL